MSLYYCCAGKDKSLVQQAYPSELLIQHRGDGIKFDTVAGGKCCDWKSERHRRDIHTDGFFDGAQQCGAGVAVVFDPGLGKCFGNCGILPATFEVELCKEFGQHVERVAHNEVAPKEVQSAV